MEGFGRQRQVLGFLGFLLTTSRFAALLLNSLQTKDDNPSQTQGIIYHLIGLIYSEAQNLTFQQNVSIYCNIPTCTAIRGETHKR